LHPLLNFLKRKQPRPERDLSAEIDALRHSGIETLGSVIALHAMLAAVVHLLSDEQRKMLLDAFKGAVADDIKGYVMPNWLSPDEQQRLRDSLSGKLQLFIRNIDNRDEILGR
jgi:hypothetical protein